MNDLVSSRYRILHSHAKGGVGEVFLAQDTQFERRVALKEIRQDRLINATRRERFLLEARITGRLEHPGIVPVYGIETQDDGRTSYVMRFIRGETLRKAVQRFHDGPAPDCTGLEFRLLLSRFVDVCNTMAYAHSQGVLHRDLKPENIMLGDFGETLVVDWGLAKPFAATKDIEPDGESLDQGSWSGDLTITTDGQALGSPAYMSPEQSSGNSMPLGPPSDIYNLGATLYVVMTNREAFEGQWELVRCEIGRGDFPPPRQVQPRVPRALEAICLKAMALQPEDRYQSALELAREIECWLADRPVTAYREPWSEKARRWVRRHQAMVSGLVAALTVGFLALGLAVPILSYAWRNEALARREERAQRAVAVANLKIAEQQRSLALASESEATEERDRAEKSLSFLVQALRKPDPALDGRSLRVADLLERAASELDTTFADAPLTRARLLQAIGETFTGLGLPRASLSAFERVVALRRETLGPDHPSTLVAMGDLATATQDAGHFDQAIDLFESVLAMQKAQLGPEHHDTQETTNSLAMAYWESGQAARAIPLYQKVLEQATTALGEDHTETLTVMDNLAVAYVSAREPLKAIPLHEGVLAKLRAKLGEESPAVLVTMNNLARAYALGGQHRKAIQLYESTLEKIRPKLGGEHPTTLKVLTGLGKAHQAAGYIEPAIRIYEQVLSTRTVTLGPDHPDTVWTIFALANACFLLNQPDRAVTLAREFITRSQPIRERLPLLLQEETREAAQLLADHFTTIGRPDEADRYRRLIAAEGPRR